MLPSRSRRYRLHKLWLGARLCCPHCGARGMFRHGGLRVGLRGGLRVGLRVGFAPRDVCPYCGTRLTRTGRDGIGGVYLTLVLALALAFSAMLLLQTRGTAAREPALLVGLVLLALLAPFVYRHARGVWLALLYLNGEIYPDPDDSREYTRPQDDPAQQRSRRQRE